MSPEPWLRYQAGALCALLIGVTVVGGATFALSLASLVTAFAFLFWFRYSSDVDQAKPNDVDQAKPSIPPHRDRLDVLVAGDIRTALLPALVLASFLVARRPAPVHVAPYVLEAAATVSVVAATVYVSSLFDWYLILPRISGLLGRRPCETKGEPPGWPGTWRSITRWWYVHRIVAAFVFVYGLALALGLVASGLTNASSSWVEFAFAAVFGTFGAYKKAIWPAVKEVGHPRIIVGRTYESRLRPRLYCFDVAIEGVDFVNASRYEDRAAQPVPEEGVEYEKDPDELTHSQALEMTGAAEPYSGCEHRCVGISWYCIDNIHCFEEK